MADGAVVELLADTGVRFAHLRGSLDPDRAPLLLRGRSVQGRGVQQSRACGAAVAR
ncbi:MAG: hypothetical protein ACT4O0_09940 [Pseudonocardia sp.]|jgi:hypothetical protein